MQIHDRPHKFIIYIYILNTRSSLDLTKYYHLRSCCCWIVSFNFNLFREPVLHLNE